MNQTLVKESKFYTARRIPYTIQFWTGEVAQVSLISAPTHAVQTIARATKGYTGYYEDADLPEEELLSFLNDLKKTKLGTPVEFLNFVFLIKDVPRSWTHQAVRTRIGAAYVQESTRFIGSRSLYKVLVPKSALVNITTVDSDYYFGTISAIGSYANMVEKKGVLSEDARQLLPHSLLTNLYWSINLKALMGVYNQRWCCMAEPSTWLPVMKQMKRWVEISCGSDIASFLTAPIDRGENCGFNASFDRPCTWRKRP
jgi:thymidylate synthase (FAD)